MWFWISDSLVFNQHWELKSRAKMSMLFQNLLSHSEFMKGCVTWKFKRVNCKTLRLNGKKRAFKQECTSEEEQAFFVALFTRPLCILGGENSARCKIQVRPVTYRNICSVKPSHWLLFVNNLQTHFILVANFSSHSATFSKLLGATCHRI